jgi:hypothetical protein
MEIQEIEVKIGKDGKVELSVHGVKGNKCLQITSELENLLGGVVLSREMSPEALDDQNLPLDTDQSDAMKTG